ncbi:Hsp70 family protein [Rhodococcoides fascians A21d2]|uniref:Hsp70 family protein n=1 Tax=Rhodococcoides fascians TaxID=1828 RepID=UPI00068FFD39|nr:Hsp70 family protein [Rhodococcus fascians]QIH99361.1 Hsp70 family protein [Rhodococcus fascians A21d2]
MSAVVGASVLGASLGSSGVRSVISNNARPGSVMEVHEPVASGPAPNGLAPDPWDAVITSVHNLAAEHASADFYPVLALRESDPRTAFDQDFSDDVVLVSELGAQLGALRETGVLAGESCVALFDVGASGTSVSVVDVHSGRVLAASRTDELGGDACDRVLCDHLIATFGAAEALTVEARRRLVHDVRVGKHQLSLLRSVSVLGPFVGGRATLWRGTLDELIGDSVHRAVSMAVDVLDAVGARGIRVDAVVAVGGGANMQIVRQVLFDAVSMPVFVPEEPELLAARGAAGIARTVGVRPAPTTHDAITEQFAAVGGDSADREVAAVVPVGAVVSKRPRHSDTSSKRMTRANKSRHLGRAVAALVAVCAAGTVVAAAARTNTDDPAPSVGSSQDSSQTVRSQSVEPASAGSPADPDRSSVPLATTTTSISPSGDASSPAPTTSSSDASTTSDAARATAPRRTTASTGATPDDDGSTAPVRPTSEQSTAAPTTTASPPTTTQAPATTSTRPTTTTARPTTTTRTTRTFDFPFPKLDMPRG